MRNAANILTPDDRARVSRRIASLEKTTDAEVVCAVATESGRYDRAESIAGFLVGLTALISGNKVAAMSDWDGIATISLGLQVGLLVGGFATGSLLASYWHDLRRLFVRKAEFKSEVIRSVHQVFSQQGIGRTAHRGGLLIYLSLFERSLEVRCDQAIAAKVQQADLEAIRDAVLARVRTGDVAGGLIAGLDRTEELLSKVYPSTGSATETLANELLLFHPRP